MKQISNISSLHTVTISKKVVFNDMKNNLFNKNISPQNISSNTNNQNNQNLFTRQNIIEVMQYIFLGDSCTINTNDLLNEVKDSIDILKTIRGLGCVTYSKSSIDVAATLYIAYIIHNQGYNVLKNSFISFENNFKMFLKNTCGIEINTIKKIRNNYIKNIKYVKGTTYIRLNNFILDTNVASIPNVERLYGSNSSIKNKQIREELSKEQIADLKTEARGYYDTKVLACISNMSDNEKRQDTILKIIYFNKLLNLTDRHLCKSEMSYIQLRQIAINSGIFDALGIKTEKEKIDFINHSIMLNYHSNAGMLFKRWFIKIPLLMSAVGGTIASIVAATTTGITTSVAVVGILGMITLVGSAADLINNFRLSSGGLKEFADSVNSGDRMNSYTNSAEQIFIKMLAKYNQYQVEDNSINKGNYKQHVAWLQTPMTSKINQYLSKEINDRSLEAIHLKTMNAMYKSGNQLRNEESLNAVCNYVIL